MTLRLFAALDIPDPVADRLKAIMRGVPGASWRPRENLHLTLSFFGDVAEPTAADLDLALDEAACAAKPFTVQLRGAGFFGKDDPHALWIGAAENPALTRLAAACTRAARKVGVQPDARAYAPHVTLAYLRGAKDIDRVLAFATRYALFSPEPFDVAGFGLYSSQTRQNAPSRYTLEASYRLGG